jgi:hypothetical protein
VVGTTRSKQPVKVLSYSAYLVRLRRINHGDDAIWHITLLNIRTGHEVTLGPLEMETPLLELLTEAEAAGALGDGLASAERHAEMQSTQQDETARLSGSLGLKTGVKTGLTLGLKTGLRAGSHRRDNP